MTNNISATSMLSDPFDKVAQRIREELRQAIQDEIREYKWIECEKGRYLSWAEASNEWTEAHRQDLGQFLNKPLANPEQPLPGIPSTNVAQIVRRRARLNLQTDCPDSAEPIQLP